MDRGGAVPDKEDGFTGAFTVPAVLAGEREDAWNRDVRREITESAGLQPPALDGARGAECDASQERGEAAAISAPTELTNDQARRRACRRRMLLFLRLLSRTPAPFRVEEAQPRRPFALDLLFRSCSAIWINSSNARG